MNSCANEFARHAQPLDVLPRTRTFRLFTGGPVERRLVSYPGPREVWGASPSLRNIKYTRMRHSNKKNSKIFSPEGPHENISSGIAVVFGWKTIVLIRSTCMHLAVLASIRRVVQWSVNYSRLLASRHELTPVKASISIGSWLNRC